jgi:hypothetical protein
VDRVDDLAAVHVDEQRVVEVANPNRAGRGRRQLVIPRIVDPILLGVIALVQLVTDVERTIAVAERIEIYADVENRPVVIAVAPPIILPIVAPVAVPAAARPAASLPNLLLHDLLLAIRVAALAVPGAALAVPVADLLDLLALTAGVAAAIAVALLLDLDLRGDVAAAAEAAAIAAIDLLLRFALRRDIPATFKSRTVETTALALLHDDWRLMDELRRLRAIEAAAVGPVRMAVAARRLGGMASAVVLLLLVVAPVAVAVLVLFLRKCRCRRCSGQEYRNYNSTHDDDPSQFPATEMRLCP